MNLPKIASISKKIVVALLGLFLVLFVGVHLGINLCLFRDDGGTWYRAASNFMGTNYVVKVFEVVLFATIIVHILLTIALQIQNLKARPQRYHRPQKTKTSFGSKYAIWTGILLLCLLMMHFCHFYFVKTGWVEGKYMISIEKILHEYDRIEMGLMEADEEADFRLFFNCFANKRDDMTKNITSDGNWIANLTANDIEPIEEYLPYFKPDFYNIAKDIFRVPIYAILYIIMFFVVGFHIVHGIPSAFQTLGLNHNKYNAVIQWLAWIYAVIIVVGFSSIPIYFLFF